MPEPERLTLAEIETRYPNEWVLLEKTELDADEEIAHGLVVAHSPRRDDYSPGRP